MEWSAWIRIKYNEWRQDKYGNAASIAEFARLFGAKHQIVLRWMEQGSEPPRNRDYVNALVKYYGREALEALGIELQEVSLSKMGGEQSQILNSILERYRTGQITYAELITALEAEGFGFIKIGQ